MDTRKPGAISWGDASALGAIHGADLFVGALALLAIAFRCFDAPASRSHLLIAAGSHAAIFLLVFTIGIYLSEAQASEVRTYPHVVPALALSLPTLTVTIYLLSTVREWGAAAKSALLVNFSLWGAFYGFTFALPGSRLFAWLA